jgi:hypothetical protein
MSAYLQRRIYRWLSRWRITPYRIKRNHCNETGPFRVNVVHGRYQQIGVGFQVGRQNEVYGLSIVFDFMVQP